MSFRWRIAVGGLILTGLVTAHAGAQAASDAARAELKSYIENVAQATARRYDARDSAGNTMDTVKIVADPAGGYLAVYHTYSGAGPAVKLATSTDLLNWTYRRDLGTHAT